MLQLIDDIGIESVQKRLSYLSGIENANSLESLESGLIARHIRQHKTAPDVTRNAAMDVAKVAFQPTLNWTLTRWSKVTKPSFRMRLADLDATDDIALQNIQARTRS
ncbi:unnamed protein product [Pylaiella littoralis]